MAVEFRLGIEKRNVCDTRIASNRDRGSDKSDYGSLWGRCRAFYGRERVTNEVFSSDWSRPLAVEYDLCASSDSTWWTCHRAERTIVCEDGAYDSSSDNSKMFCSYYSRSVDGGTNFEKT